MINVGLIGYGYWGPNLARNFADTDGVRLAYCADVPANPVATPPEAIRLHRMPYSP